MSWRRIQETAEKDERRRTILREAEERLRHELLDIEERALLRDRILRLRRQLKLANA